MNDGANLTLAAVAALAVAGAVRRRGSRSNGSSLEPNERAQIVRLVKTGDPAFIAQARAFSEALVGYLDLRGADLKLAELYMANLRGADLQGADLRCTHLNGANLTGANLRGANLHRGSLVGANLQGANLEGADLEWVTLTWADLTDIYYDATTTWPRGFTPPPSRSTP